MENIKEKVRQLKEKIGRIRELEIDEEYIELSFLAHEFGIRILTSPEVYEHYYPLKDKHLSQNAVLEDEEITELVKQALSKAMSKIDNSNKILGENSEILNNLLNMILRDKRTFIKAIREKNIEKIFLEIKNSLGLSSKTKTYDDNKLKDLLLEVLREVRGNQDINEAISDKTGNTESITLKCSNKIIRPKLENYKSESPIKKMLAERLLTSSPQTVVKTFIKDLPKEIKSFEVDLEDDFMSHLENELLSILDEISRDTIYRETLPSHFDIPLNIEGYSITQFLAYVKLLKTSNIRLMKNYRDNTNILDDDVEILSRSFSFLGLKTQGLESQEIYKKTGTRSDTVEIGKASGSTSYPAIAKILDNKISSLDITDAEIANWIIEVLDGRGKEILDTLEITRFQREILERFINSLTYLMFSTEVVRNPASLVINYMILELIKEGEEYLSWEEVFENRGMPMSIVGAVSSSRWMHSNYDTTIRYSYDKTKSSFSNDNSEKDMKILQDIIYKEGTIFRLWLSLNGLEYENEDSFLEAISLLGRKCSEWYGATVLSRQLIIDLLTGILENEIEDEVVQLENNELENLLKIASDEDTKEILKWYFKADISELDNDILGQILDLKRNQLKVLAKMVTEDHCEEKDTIYKLLYNGLELLKCITILKIAIDQDNYLIIDSLCSLDTDQLDQLYELITENKCVLQKFEDALEGSHIKLEEILKIYDEYSDSEEKIEEFLDREFLSLRSDYKDKTRDSISLEDFYALYKENENKLRFLLDYEDKYHLIRKIGYNDLSMVFNDVCDADEIDQDNLYDIDHNELEGIYESIYEYLQSCEVINSEKSDSEEDLNIYFCSNEYCNYLLNNYQGHKLLELISKNKNIAAFDLFLELGESKSLTEQVLEAIDELGVEKVLEIFFADKIDSSKLDTTESQEQALSAKNQEDAQLLETIAQIEAVIGKEALAKLAGWNQYISKALSNNPFSVHATNVIQAIGNLVSNFEEWLDFGIVYEGIELDNQIAIILAQLENMFDFVASGITNIGLPPRYPDFDPDDYYGGGSAGGDGGNNGDGSGINNIDFSSLFAGQNTNATYDL